MLFAACADHDAQAAATQLVPAEACFLTPAAVLLNELGHTVGALPRDCNAGNLFFCGLEKPAARPAEVHGMHARAYQEMLTRRPEID